MHSLSFPRWIEISASVLAVTFVLALVFAPAEEGTRDALPSRMDPEEVIAHARETYNLTQCVEQISPKTVLGESREGSAPAYTVYEGESVKNCFPGTEFITFAREGHSDVAATPTASSDAHTLLPKSAAETGEGNIVTSVKVAIPVPEKKDITATSSPQPASASAAPAVSVSGGSGASASAGSAPEPVNAMPTEEKFVACGKEVFADVIPEEPTDEQIEQMGNCLLRGV